MNRSIILRLALVIGLSVSSSTLARAAEPAQGAQGTPVIPPAAPGTTGGMTSPGGADRDRDMKTGAGGMDGMMDGMGLMGPAGMHRMMMGHMMMQQMRQMSPAQRCDERLARRAARVAYTLAKLHLTSEQRPLWDKVGAALDVARQREEKLCADLKNVQPQQQTILDRVGRVEQFLGLELDTIKQVRPALEQFYQVLSPEQKAIIDQHLPRG